MHIIRVYIKMWSTLTKKVSTSGREAYFVWSILVEKKNDIRVKNQKILLNSDKHFYVTFFKNSAQLFGSIWPHYRFGFRVSLQIRLQSLITDSASESHYRFGSKVSLQIRLQSLITESAPKSHYKFASTRLSCGQRSYRLVIYRTQHIWPHF